MSHTKKGDNTMRAVRIGLDIAKSSFQIHGVDAHGKVVICKHLPGAVFRGALGPFVVVDVPRVPQCCNVYHTTAGRVLKHNWEPFPPDDSPGVWPQIRQPWTGGLTNLWDAVGWQLMLYYSKPQLNHVSVQPDWAIMTHGNPPQPDVPPYSALCTAVDSNTAPVREVYYGPHSRVDGPNGAILPVGTNADVKIFGSESAHASIAHSNTT